MRPKRTALAAAACFALLTGAYAAKPKVEPVLIRAAAHPLDSRGDTVYTLREEETKDEPAVPGVVKLPKAKKTPAPEYPPSLKRAKEEAVVEVSCVVAPDGHVIDAEVLGDVADDVRATTLNAVSSYEISPATLDGKPVAFRMKIVMQYRIW